MILIVGHTDNVGKNEYNQKQSLRRAKAVKVWLVRLPLNRLNTMRKIERTADALKQTLEQIGERLQLTRERVRQIKEAALKRLRRRSSLERPRKFFGSSIAAISA